MSDAPLNIFVFILILNDLRSPSHLKGYTECLILAGNKYQLPTFGVNAILSFSKTELVTPTELRSSKFPPGEKLLCDRFEPPFLRSFYKSGTFKNPTQVN